LIIPLLILFTYSAREDCAIAHITSACVAIATHQGGILGTIAGPQSEIDGELRRLGQVQVAGKKERQNSNDDHTYADRVITPALAVGPNGKAAQKSYDQGDRENKQKSHGLGACLTNAAGTCTASIRGDSARKHSAISALMLASASW
jgi:hypothetical protein